MPISVARLREMTATAPIEYFGEKGEVTYRLGAISEQMFDDIEALSIAAEEDDEEAINQLNMMLAEIVESWDVVDDNGEPLPIVNEDGSPASALRMLPIPFKTAVLMQIMEHSQGKGMRNGRRSWRGSRRKAR